MGRLVPLGAIVLSVSSAAKSAFRSTESMVWESFRGYARFGPRPRGVSGGDKRRHASGGRIPRYARTSHRTGLSETSHWPIALSASLRTSEGVDWMYFVQP